MQNKILSSYPLSDIQETYETDLGRCCIRCLKANLTDPANSPCSTFSFCETDGKCIALTKPGFNSSTVPTTVAQSGCSVYSWTPMDQTNTVSRVYSHSATTSFGLLFTPDVNQTYNYTVAFKSCVQQQARLLDIGNNGTINELCDALRLTMGIPVGKKLWIRSYPRANPCGYDSHETVKHFITVGSTNCTFTFDQSISSVNATALCFYPSPDTHAFAVTNNSVTTNYLAFLGYTMTYAEAQQWCSDKTGGTYGLHKLVTHYYQLGQDLEPVMRPRFDLYPCGMRLWIKQVAPNCTYNYIDFNINDRTIVSASMENICGVADRFPFCSDKPI